jgi:hypothetical protein
MVRRRGRRKRALGTRAPILLPHAVATRSFRGSAQSALRIRLGRPRQLLAAPSPSAQGTPTPFKNTTIACGLSFEEAQGFTGDQSAQTIVLNVHRQAETHEVSCDRAVIPAYDSLQLLDQAKSGWFLDRARDILTTKLHQTVRPLTVRVSRESVNATAFLGKALHP